jgi:hypothetical protein
MSTIEYHGFEGVAKISDFIFDYHDLQFLILSFPKLIAIASVWRNKLEIIIISGKNLEKIRRTRVLNP